MTEKRCSTCGDTKTVEQFSKNRTKPDGLRSSCRSCDNKRCRDYRSGLSAEIKLSRNQSRDREHSRANNFVNNKIRSGQWQKPTVCVICGSTASVQWHHDDYAYLDEVIELCGRLCHPMADKAKRERDSLIERTPHSLG